MKIEDLTQGDLDIIFSAYHSIAFPYANNLHIIYEDVEKVKRGECTDGFRFGIEGWPHTKLKLNMMLPLKLIWWIYPNGDKFSKRQKRILKELDKWAAKL